MISCNSEKYSSDIEFKVEDKQDGNEHNFFFKDNNGNLLGYIRFNYIDTTIGSPIIHINETTSSYRYDFHPEFFKDLYRENGYNPEVKIKDFGKDMYLYVFNFIIKNYPSVKIVNLCSLDKKANRESIRRVIKRVQEISSNIIEKVLGGNKDGVCSTIFLNNGVKELTLKEMLENKY